MRDKTTEECNVTNDGQPERQRWNKPTVLRVPLSDSEGSTFHVFNVDGTSSTS